MSDAAVPARHPIPAIVAGLPTTAGKVRALAQAGYSRAEIRKAQGIRYQHVRNVLLHAGIGCGPTPAVELERTTVALPVDPQKRKPTSSAVLLAGGFALLGEWKRRRRVNSN